MGSWPKYLRLAFTAARMKFTMVTPGNLHGILERKEQPLVGAVFGRQSEEVGSVE